jgi:HSP20 family molecular chaperone IbpA
VTSAIERIRGQLWPSGPRFENIGPIGEFAVRAEIPGVDPVHDIRIWPAGRVLTVEVMRAPTRSDQVRSEFHYGRSVGTVDLPPMSTRRLSADMIAAC